MAEAKIPESRSVRAIYGELNFYEFQDLLSTHDCYSGYPLVPGSIKARCHPLQLTGYSDLGPQSIVDYD